MDESPRHLPVRSSDPFWPRIRHATVMLLAALAVHTWGLRAPDGIASPSPAGALWMRAVAGSEPVAQGERPEGGIPPRPANRVTVDEEIIEAPVVPLPAPSGPAAAGPAQAYGAKPRPEPGPVAATGALARQPDPVPAGGGAAQILALGTTGAGGAAASPEQDLTRPVHAPEDTRRRVDVPALPLRQIDTGPWQADFRSPAAMLRPAVDPIRAGTAPAMPPPRVSDAAAGARDPGAPVRAVLQQYTRAVELMDVQAAKAVWPSVDVQGLRKSFQDTKTQRMRLGDCEILVKERAANAHCRGDISYAPRVGRREERKSVEWTFSFAQADDRWEIVGVTLN